MDDADYSIIEQQAELDRMIAAARGEIKPGKAGECELCGEHSMRLIDAACAYCRDRYKLK